MQRPDFDDWTADDLTVLYRDDDLLVVSKPGGMLVHRGWGNDKVVLVDLAADIVGNRVKPVHRLDRQTSGVIALPTTSEFAGKLGPLFMARKVKKQYLALVRGVAPSAGVINHAIPRKKRGERRPAVTLFKRRAALEHASVVEAFPRTGRLHQIRRHFKHIRHPLVGDSNYGTGWVNRKYRQRYNLRRLGLHAWRLSFPDPRTGKLIAFEAPIPSDLRDVYSRLGVLDAVEQGPSEPM